MLTSVGFSWSTILGEQGINAGISPLYLPGGLLAIAAIFAALLHTKVAKAQAKLCL